MQIVSKSMQLFLWMLMPLMGIVSKWTALDKKENHLKQKEGNQKKSTHTLKLEEQKWRPRTCISF